MKQICITECTVSEAMSQIDTLAELTPKTRAVCASWRKKCFPCAKSF